VGSARCGPVPPLSVVVGAAVPAVAAEIPAGVKEARGEEEGREISAGGEGSPGAMALRSWASNSDSEI